MICIDYLRLEFPRICTPMINLTCCVDMIMDIVYITIKTLRRTISFWEVMIIPEAMTSNVFEIQAAIFDQVSQYITTVTRKKTHVHLRVCVSLTKPSRFNCHTKQISIVNISNLLRYVEKNHLCY